MPQGRNQSRRKLVLGFHGFHDFCFSAGPVSPEMAFHMFYRPPPPRIPVVSFNNRMPMRPNIPTTIPQQAFSLSRVPTVPMTRQRMPSAIRRPNLPSLPSRGPPPVLVPRHIIRQPSQISQPSPGNSDVIVLE